MMTVRIPSMRKQRRQHSKEFKLGVISEVEGGKPIAQAAREYSLHPNVIYKWLVKFDKYGTEAFQGNGNSYTDESREAALERKIGQLTMEIDILKKALTRMEEIRRKEKVSG
jgi:transposase